LFDRDARLLTLSLPPAATAAQLKDRVEAWLQNEARALFRERLELYEKRLGTRHRVLRLSSAKTRWGSCSADGQILLNWRLIHFPLSTIDYVVAHELAHLKEMNHGPRFWATVATLLPDYEAAREQVRNPPPELTPVL
jgi:predicted metal-dependent hydrolase